MAMRSATSPRRVYTRGGSPIVCFGGAYYGPPAKKESKINVEKEVTIEVLENSGGKKRIAVTQKSGSKKVTEQWGEKQITKKEKAED